MTVAGPDGRNRAPIKRPSDLAFGRWLVDLGPLSDAERALVDACAAGDWFRPGSARPETPAAHLTVRADLVRFLALGGDQLHPVHEAGIQLAGAWIAGRLRLSSAAIEHRINLLDCVLDAPLHAYDARFRSLNLSGSALAGLHGDRLSVAGSVFLRSGFTSCGPVSLAGAHVNGDVDASGGCFHAPNLPALDLSGAAVAGQLGLMDGVLVDGELRLAGTKIGGTLSASGSRFANPQGVAIGGDALQAACNVLLDRGATIEGELRLGGAAIGGHLSLSVSTIDNPGGVALQAEHIEIAHALILRDARIDGRVILTDARAGALADDLESWPDGQIVLDGFEYQCLSSPDVAGDRRTAWLMRQVASDIGATFRPQPWEQLTRVLRDMGHSRDATLVAVGKQRALRRAGQIGTRRARILFEPIWERHPALRAVRRLGSCIATSTDNVATRALHDLYGIVAGFGYRPGRIVGWMLAIWFAGGVYFDQMARAGIMAPAEPTLLIAALEGTGRPAARYGPADCGVRNEVSAEFYWWHCPGMPSEYQHFNPWLFSADLILPVVDFHQFTYWAPAATFTTRSGEVREMAGGITSKIVEWSIVLAGWAMSLLFGAIMTRLVERD